MAQLTHFGRLNAKKAFLVCAAAVSVLLGASGAAQAQSLFDRSRNVGVRERAHPEYDAAGLRAGAFIIHPKLEVGVSYDDNVYAAQTAKAGDTIFEIHPQVTAATTWSRHSLSFAAESTSRRYNSLSQENSTDWRVSGQGVFDIQRGASLTGTASYLHGIEPRGSALYTLVTDSPIEYTQGVIGVGGVKEFNRVRLSGGANLTKSNYDDGVTPGGVIVDQDFRDNKTVTGTARADYALSPATALFADLAVTSTDYDQLGASNRNSTGQRILAGVNFELSQLITGEASIGYDVRQYDDTTVSDVKNFSYRAGITWFPTQLLTAQFKANRYIADSGLASSVSYTSDTLSAQADYEVLRNLIVTVTLERASDKYQSIDRKDDRYGAGLAATYLVNRSVGVALKYTLLDQNSKGTSAGVDFTENRVGLALILQH